MTITCATCKACCCRLEVLLLPGDEPPAAFTDVDRWGGHVMRRLEDGWCAALDRSTFLCRIYEHRPGTCREFEMGGEDCRAERASITGR